MYEHCINILNSRASNGFKPNERCNRSRCSREAKSVVWRFTVRSTHESLESLILALDAHGGWRRAVRVAVPGSQNRDPGGSESGEKRLFDVCLFFFLQHYENQNQTIANLKTKHPKADHRIAALAVRMNVPLLGTPGDSPWGFSTNATWILADDWLGQPVPVQVDTPALIKKYLAAFGPATPADAQAWSGCKGLRAEFEKLRPELKVFQNEKGQELFDLPRAPRPPLVTPRLRLLAPAFGF